MGKFDGMDPQLVRELLGETKRAAVELRETEARVSRVLSRAGVATQTTHRPRQVADEADRMVKDVSARLDLLEKRAAGESPSTDPPPDDKGTKTPEPDAKNPAPTKPDAEGRDEKPEQKKPDAREREQPDADTGEKPDARDQGKPDPDTGEKPDARDPGKPDADNGEKPDARDQGKPDADGACDRAPGTEKPDAGEPRDGSAQNIADTPRKDHPDDVDTSKPQVIEIDGVKVLQVPIDPPTAQELEDLLESLDQVQPAEMPSVGPTPEAGQAVSDVSGTGQGVGQAVSDTSGTGQNATSANGDRGLVVPPTPPPDDTGTVAVNASDALIYGDARNDRLEGPLDLDELRELIERAAGPADGPPGQVEPGEPRRDDDGRRA
ncbi:hypothetical protein AB0J42_15495 [Nonomuraea sp. NPDC049649]|uniref:hypothetical protein n=1 Tax=Nonomuraea sp. NPDC049649 TaxID=3155776 RepID=UPI003414BACC